MKRLTLCVVLTVLLAASSVLAGEMLPNPSPPPAPSSARATVTTPTTHPERPRRDLTFPELIQLVLAGVLVNLL